MFDALLGLKVVYVDGARVFTENHLGFEFFLAADCCSKSSFTSEGLAALKELVGATILMVEDREGGETPDPGPNGYRHGKPVPPWAFTEEYESECSRWHFLVFTTNKGHVTVDWRNESNGYYDGEVYVDRCQPLQPVPHDAACDGRLDFVESLPLELRYVPAPPPPPAPPPSPPRQRSPGFLSGASGVSSIFKQRYDSFLPSMTTRSPRRRK